MSLEIKRHTVPHLNGLNSVIEPLTRHVPGTSFKLHHTTLKSAYFPSYSGQAAVSYEHSCIIIKFVLSQKTKVLSVHYYFNHYRRVFTQELTGCAEIIKI